MRVAGNVGWQDSAYLLQGKHSGRCEARDVPIIASADNRPWPHMHPFGKICRVGCQYAVVDVIVGGVYAVGHSCCVARDSSRQQASDLKKCQNTRRSQAFYSIAKSAKQSVFFNRKRKWSILDLCHQDRVRGSII